SPSMTDVESRALVNTYCVGCHDEGKRATKVSLAAFGIATAAHDPELGEKIVHTLRAGVHPPSGRPRPDPTAIAAFTASVEAAIDQAEGIGLLDGSEHVSDRELASRVARLIWNTEPDRDLLVSASAGRLRSPLDLQTQVGRMISDSRSSA